MKKRYVLILLLFALLVFGGCSKKDDPVNENNTNEPVVEDNNNEEEEVVKPTFAYTYPFTGEQTNDDVTQRPVGVMINNHPAARPQSGLAEADIVIEMLAEGSITRFLALYQSDLPEVVGPVRSAREYYFELANGYDATYVFHGAAWFIKDILVQRGYDHLDGALYDNDRHLFKRESFRKAPHNSYVLIDAVNEVGRAKGYRTDSQQAPLPFHEPGARVTGEMAQHINIAYPGRTGSDVIEYKYDAAKEIYTRYDRQVQTANLTTEEPVELSNLFLIEAAHQVIDNDGRRKIDMTSGGSALLVQQGHVQKVDWKNDAGRLVAVLDGNVIDFLPGKTWINVVPTTPGLETTVTVSHD